jgi:uncharacterized membrane protein YcaP (DUF421 family)
MKTKIVTYIIGFSQEFLPTSRELFQISEFRVVIFMTLIGTLLTQLSANTADRTTIVLVFVILLLALYFLVIFSKYGRRDFRAEVIVAWYAFSISLISVSRYLNFWE